MNLWVIAAAIVLLLVVVAATGALVYDAWAEHRNERRDYEALRAEADELRAVIHHHIDHGLKELS